MVAGDPWQLIAHLWNGQWGWARLDIYVHCHGDRWRVRALQRQGRWGEDEWDRLDMAAAYRYVRVLMRDAPGLGPWPWRDIAGAHRQY